MPAAPYNFTIEQGATFKKIITWVDSTGNPVNLTNYVGRMQLRDSQGGSTLYLEINSTSGGITFNAQTGQITLNISAIQTAALTAKKAFYDLKLIDPSGNVYRLLEGKVTIVPGVTV